MILIRENLNKVKMNFDIERLKNNIIFSIMFSSIKLQSPCLHYKGCVIGYRSTSMMRDALNSKCVF